jgi:cytochrome c oxidase subunit 3
MVNSISSQPLERNEEHSHDVQGTSLFGFIVFLLSESIIFFSFFAGYIALKTTSPQWLPEGIKGLDTHDPLINTIVLVSSSFVIYVAEEFLKKGNLPLFRVFWLLTSAMGIYFLVGQAIEWRELQFGLTSGAFGGTFYLLTGFHGLHVLIGVLLQFYMLYRSFIPGNYDAGHTGVTEVSLFWHFVDVIWIILFCLIYVWQ